VRRVTGEAFASGGSQPFGAGISTYTNPGETTYIDESIGRGKAGYRTAGIEAGGLGTTYITRSAGEAQATAGTYGIAHALYFNGAGTLHVANTRGTAFVDSGTSGYGALIAVRNTALFEGVVLQIQGAGNGTGLYNLNNGIVPPGTLTINHSTILATTPFSVGVASNDANLLVQNTSIRSTGSDPNSKGLVVYSSSALPTSVRVLNSQIESQQKAFEYSGTATQVHLSGTAVLGGTNPPVLPASVTCVNTWNSAAHFGTGCPN
jgi:hypothetical protein